MGVLSLLVIGIGSHVVSSLGDSLETQYLVGSHYTVLSGVIILALGVMVFGSNYFIVFSGSHVLLVFESHFASLMGAMPFGLGVILSLHQDDSQWLQAISCHCWESCHVVIGR